MTLRTQVLIGVGCLVALLAAYGAGRFTAPSRVEADRKASNVTTATSAERDTKNATTDEVVNRKITQRKAPARPAAPASANGVCPECPAVDETVIEEEVHRRLTDKGVIERAASAVTAQTEESHTVTSREYPRLTLGVGVAAALRNPANIAIAGAVNYRVAGPFGVWVAGSTADGGVVMAGASVTF